MLTISMISAFAIIKTVVALSESLNTDAESLAAAAPAFYTGEDEPLAEASGSVSSHIQEITESTGEMSGKGKEISGAVTASSAEADRETYGSGKEASGIGKETPGIDKGLSDFEIQGEVIIPDSGSSFSHDQRATASDIPSGLDSSFINLLLVNKWHALPEGFTPANLVSLSENGKKPQVNAKFWTMKLNYSALQALIRMFRAAEESDISGLVVSSGYRTIKEQDNNFKAKVQQFLKSHDEKTAIEKAAQVVAPPGESEHHTGLAVDLTTTELLAKSSQLTPAFGATRQGKWVYENSWRFGFIIRYQPEKTDITGIANEPWHIRYVGIPHAELMHKSSMCLEEYLNFLKAQKTVEFEDIYGTVYEITYNHGKAIPAYTNAHPDSTDIFDVSQTGEGGTIITRVKQW